MISTPRGKGWFYDVFRRGQRGDRDFESWNHPSWTNPHLDRAVIEAERTRLTPRHASRRFRGLLHEAGIGRVRGTHVLRHSLGDRLYRQTGDIELVRAVLHHRSVASTMVYARCGGDRIRAAIEKTLETPSAMCTLGS